MINEEGAGQIKSWLKAQGARWKIKTKPKSQHIKLNVESNFLNFEIEIEYF